MDRRKFITVLPTVSTGLTGCLRLQNEDDSSATSSTPSPEQEQSQTERETQSPTERETPTSTETPTEAQQSSLVAADSLEHRYTFENALNDTEGKSTGELRGNATLVDGGRTGKGVDVPSNDGFFEANAEQSAPFTLTFWMNADEINGGGIAENGFGYRAGTNRQDKGYQMKRGSARGFHVFAGSTSYSIGSRIIETGTWMLLGLRVDASGTITVFKNGSEAGRVTAPPKEPLATANLRVGGPGGFDGRYDDVRVYSTALTASQIQTIFEGG